MLIALWPFKMISILRFLAKLLVEYLLYLFKKISDFEKSVTGMKIWIVSAYGDLGALSIGNSFYTIDVCVCINSSGSACTLLQF